ncbi:RHG18-like protein [Mya arenaria]|uniref:RHG18-like protein n=1 Tax=Mya arenaria TaxID=6604 RepID=A0ABY7F9Q6_MYAAR|nr:RHG18-like protein [Mya arenaria]
MAKHDLQDFWHELGDIENSKNHDEEEETSKTPDAGKELSEDEVRGLTESLPRSHKEVVKRRVDTLNATLRKKQKYTTKIDRRERPSTLPRGLKLGANGDTSTLYIKKEIMPFLMPTTPELYVGTSSNPFYFGWPKHLSKPKNPDSSRLNKSNDDIDKIAASEVGQNLTKSKSDDILKERAKSEHSEEDFHHFDHSRMSKVKHRIASSRSIHPHSNPVESGYSSNCESNDSLDDSVILTQQKPSEKKLDPTFEVDAHNKGQGQQRSKDLQSSQDTNGIGHSQGQQKSNDLHSSQHALYKGQSQGQLRSSDNLHPWQDTYDKGHSQGQQKSPDSIHQSVQMAEVDSVETALKVRSKSRPLSNQISPQSPITHKFVNNITIGLEVPRSPTSPRGEVVHPEWAAIRAEKGRQGAKKGVYSMTGVTEELQDNVELDGDITFEFSITENGGDSSPLRGEPVISQFLKSEADLPEDVTYVRNLAFLELTSMFDTHNIAFSRRRSKKKYNEHGIFGVPLQLLLEHDQKLSPNTPHIPIVFQEILHYLHKNCLEAEGILRIPGSSSRIKTLRQEIEERFYQGTFVGQDLTPNDVAALMKQFLRDLPALLDLLIKIVENSAKNKMSLNNVSMIMAPNLFLAPKIRRLNPSKGKDAMDLEIKMAAGTSNIMRIRHYESEQVKKLKEKPKMKFLQKKDKTDVYKKPAEGVIRVQAPKLSLASTKVQLDLSTTAGDIVSRFCFQNESADSSNSHTSRVFHAADKNTFLFEVGGNIGERCLPDSTNMLALYKSISDDNM